MEQSPLYVQKEFETDEVVDVWEVSRRRVHLGALIGSGAFGRVHAAQLDMPGGETIMVAAKMLTENATEEEMQDFLREIVMLKHVGSHKHVIRLIACCTRHAPLIALLEHAPRGDLLTLLRSARGRRKEHGSSVTRRADSEPRRSEADTEYTNLSDSDPTLSEGKLYVEGETLKSRDHYVAEPALQLDSATMRDYALQVAMGMSHLEERGITHRDLAARNILVDGAGVLKVADFGLSRVGVYVHTRSRPVPLRWLAPEAILHSQYCNASDVWAFAVLLWEIATLGGFPYAELSNHQVPPFLAGGGRLPKPARASPRLYELMVECWSEEPQDRPTFANIVDKLSVQRQLYVDLDSLLSPDEEVAFDDYEFMIPNVIIKATNILLLISGIFGWPWPRADDPLLFIENPVEAEMPGHWLPLSIVKIILERSTKPVQHKIQLKLTITRPRSTTTTTEATTTTTEATSTTTEATSTTTEATTTPTTTLHTTPEETTTTTEPATTTKPATATTEPPTTTTTTLEPTTTTTSTTTTEPTTTTTTEPTTTTTTPTTTTTTEPPTTTTTPTTTTEPPTTTTTPTTTSTTEPTTTTTTTTEATTAATGRKTPRRKTNKRPDSHDNMQA